MKNVIGENNQGGNDGGRSNAKAKLIWALLFLFCLILIFFLVYMMRTPAQEQNNPNNNSSKTTSLDSDSYFKDCKVLMENCTDVNCTFYNSCDGMQPECRIYDCGKEYGIFIKKADGKIETKTEAKPDVNAIAAEKDSCSGTMQIIEQKCVDNKFQAKIKLTTKGECKIGSFGVTMSEYGNVSSGFERQEDGTYVVTSDRCGTTTRIVPVTEDGMGLEF